MKGAAEWVNFVIEKSPPPGGFVWMTDAQYREWLEFCMANGLSYDMLLGHTVIHERQQP